MPRKKIPKTFQSIKRVWYNKLKSSGFEDIEKGEYLKRFDSFHFAGYSKEQHKEIDEYYTQCQEFLKTHMFYSKSDKHVWKKHCEGYTDKEIAETIGVTERAINYVVNRLKKVMEDDRSDNNS